MTTRKQTLFEKLARNIKLDNVRFKRASPAFRRVIVAQDVLKLLDARKLNVVPNNAYCELPDAARTMLEADGSDQLQLSELIPRLPPCTVCGVGAAMVATILVRNEVTVGGENIDWNFLQISRPRDETPVGKMTDDVFTSELLDLIENSFECSHHGYDHVNPTRRLRAIYQNIIDNGGKRFTNCRNGDVVWQG